MASDVAPPTAPDPDLALPGRGGLTPREEQALRDGLGREATALERALVAAAWSEHCAYKSSRHALTRLPSAGAQVLQGPGENAGAVRLRDGRSLVFKIESHNHPSAKVPFHGAATGVGGIVRDVVALGARPIALLQSLRFGPSGSAETRRLLPGVVAGLAHQANCEGIPTVGGELGFDPGFEGACLVNACAVGLLEGAPLSAGPRQAEGALLLLGAPTGPEGFGGATFSSAPLVAGQTDASAIQVGDPFLGGKLIGLLLALKAALGPLRLAVQDLGAAGIAGASLELGHKGGVGIALSLDAIPVADPALPAVVRLLSETQERFLVAVAEADVAQVLQLAAAHAVQAAAIGRFGGAPHLTLLQDGALLSTLPLALLAAGCPAPARPPPFAMPNVAARPLAPFDAGALLPRLLGHPEVASKRWLHGQYDSTLHGRTLAGPGEAAAAVLALDGRAHHRIALTVAGNSRGATLAPRLQARRAVAEAARSLACVGAAPLGLSDGLNLGPPRTPLVAWQLEETVEGLREAALALAIPVVSGNVSLNNAGAHGPIPPTAMVAMVGELPEGMRHVGRAPTKAGLTLLLLRPKSAAMPTLGGSLARALLAPEEESAPEHVDLAAEQSLQNAVRRLLALGLLDAVDDVGRGGLATSLARMCVAGPASLGLSASLPDLPTEAWFAEPASWLLLATTDVNAVQRALDAPTLQLEPLGITNAGGEFAIDGLGRWPLAALETAFAAGFAQALALP